MYSEKEKQLLSISRAVIDLHGFFIVTEENIVIDNPKILIDLLNTKELSAYDRYTERTVQDKLDIEESIVLTKIVQIINYPNQTISLTYSPAGIISFISEAVIMKSQSYIADPVEEFEKASQRVVFLESMIAIISYYTNTPYEIVGSWPVNQIFKRYAVCQSAFPSQINKIENIEEEEIVNSKIG